MEVPQTLYVYFCVCECVSISLCVCVRLVASHSFERLIIPLPWRSPKHYLSICVCVCLCVCQCVPMQSSAFILVPMRRVLIKLIVGSQVQWMVTKFHKNRCTQIVLPVKLLPISASIGQILMKLVC